MMNPKSPVARIPSRFGKFQMESFPSEFPDFPHVALYKKDWKETPTVRIHSECMTGDVFGSLRCDCGLQLNGSMQTIHEQGGYLIYLRQEGRGIGLNNKLLAYNLQDQGMDTFQANEALGFHADDRDFTPAVEYLKKEGITEIRLMTNNPEKVSQVEALGIKVLERVPIVIPVDEDNEAYIKAKRDQAGHML